MATMRAALWTGTEQIEVREIERPTPGLGEALLKVGYGGICGTDLMIYLGKHPRAKAPLVMCHEFSGTVVEANGGPVPEGTNVAINPLLTCGACFACRSGIPHVCETLGLVGIDADGGFAEYCAVPHYMLKPVADLVTLKQAAVVEPLAVGVHAVHVSDLKVGDVTVVLGAGPIGIMTAAVAQLAGARTVFVSERSSKRVEVAKQMGFQVIDVRERDTVQAVMEATQGVGVPVVFETAGVQATLDQAAKLARIGGQILQVGIPKTPPTIDITGLLFREIRRTPIRVYRDADVELAAELAGSGKLDLDTPVTHVLPLDRLHEAMEIAHQATDACKILIDPWA